MVRGSSRGACRSSQQPLPVHPPHHALGLFHQELAQGHHLPQETHLFQEERARPR